MLIDVHTHVGNFNNKKFIIDDLIKSMDEAEIDYSVLISSHFLGAKMEELIPEVKKYSRIKLIGNVDYSQFSEAHIDSLIEHVKKKDIVGIKFYPGYENYFPYEGQFDRIYDFCQSEGVPVMFHTGFLLTGTPGKLRQAHPLNVDDIADTYPNLKIVIAHMGNPWVYDAAAVMTKNKNVYGDISGFFTEYQTISLAESDFFVQRLQEVSLILAGFNKCIFGTDYPLYSQLDYLNSAYRIHMSKEEEELVFWKNANNLFNLGL